MSERAVILVVEDSAPTRAFLADNLTADGYEVLAAGELARGAADARAAPGRPRGRRRRPARRLRARAAARASARAAGRARGSTRGCRCSSSPAGRGRPTACAASSAAPTTSSPSRSPTASCGCGSRRCCGAPASAASDGPPARRRAGARPGRARGAACAARASTLSAKEFALLRPLAAEPTRVFTKAELLRDVWGFRALGATRTLDSHACRLRRKLARRRRPLRDQRLGRRLPARSTASVGEAAAGATAAAMGERVP